MVKVRKKEDANKLIGRCLLWSAIPFNFAKNPFYVSMFEVTTIVGPGFKPPSNEELRGPILQDEKTDCTHRLEELQRSWDLTRCSVMSDGWTDMRGRTLLNFLVHCPRGTMFMRSVDASAHVKDEEPLVEDMVKNLPHVSMVCNVESPHIHVSDNDNIFSDWPREETITEIDTYEEIHEVCNMYDDTPPCSQARDEVLESFTPCNIFETKTFKADILNMRRTVIATDVMK